MLELVISVASDVFIGLFGAERSETRFKLVVARQIGREASYHCLNADRDDIFEKFSNKSSKLLGSAYFSMVASSAIALLEK